MTAWRVLARRTLLKRRWLEIEEQRVALPHGRVIEQFHLLRSPDWAAVVALTEDRQLVLVSQYRHGLGGISRELPAGVVDPGESPQAAAARELLEETGYRAAAMRPLCEVATETVRHTNRAHFFFAEGARRVAEPRLDPDEQIEVELLPCRELLDAIDSGRIQHGVHVGALLLAARRGWLPDAD